MRPENSSNRLLGVTQSKAKMIEYNVPEEDQQINLAVHPSMLFPLSIGLLGDLAASINEERPGELVSEVREHLIFSAKFFDAYMQSNMHGELKDYLVLLGSASYYLCDLPGSSSVLGGMLPVEIDLGCEGIEYALQWILKSGYMQNPIEIGGVYASSINAISMLLVQYFKEGLGGEPLVASCAELRMAAYTSGTARELLLADILSALVRKKIQNSTWNSLPEYSGMPKDVWSPVLQKDTFIKELWPAQHLLGEQGVFRGESAIVQMPTSAGKTKATELVIRSAFLSGRTNLAVIVAPFRALCHEIKNSLVAAFKGEAIKADELSDVIQADFDIDELVEQHQVVIVTPEKLVYVLRHSPELADFIGLIVFDEGHQFDNGKRGITYELLLTSLRAMLLEHTQQVLISAVISNAASVGEWLNGHQKVVEGSYLNPTHRSIGFASWLDRLGQIRYVDEKNADQELVFVPRIIEKIELAKRGMERVPRYFPVESDGKSIALYLALKLVRNGSIAIFCGQKTTASSLCDMAVDVIGREVPMALPLQFSDHNEVARLFSLHVENLGNAASATQSAAHGIFSHHGNTPQGIRLAVEYAMSNDLIRFVVCTSTLAQGVNLPIKYLIMTNFYQAGERIKVRDFHNLIGRAGRSGMHTEGSILFADPKIYDRRRAFRESWRWQQVKELLDPSNSEPCISNLLSVFEPIKSDDEKTTLVMNALDFATLYVNSPEQIPDFTKSVADMHGDKGFSVEGVRAQISWRIGLISALESFLLSHWEEYGDDGVSGLAEETLAYYLADADKKEHIRSLFRLLSGNIAKTIEDDKRKKMYGKVLYGIRDAAKIERWVEENIDEIQSIENHIQFMELIWPLLIEHVSNKMFHKFDDKNVLFWLAVQWMEGKSYGGLLATADVNNARIIWGQQRRVVTINHIVEVCEHAFSYDGALLLGAIAEFVELFDLDDADYEVEKLKTYQKRFKYGLPSACAVSYYELGFADRVIAQTLSDTIQPATCYKASLISKLKENREFSFETIAPYPEYYRQQMIDIIS
ncbi:DEAD/DEAH box helicase [Pseudodesulfovibrio sp. JC047]|uniref:DEAD/DEAH box helicase n=1 Tax=Pseudodesulfovibrio sp. JC047 TaxID=2683199 RepID=UPI0013D0A212|nr:DEAD/DEAH box helicase [Pseudodesulfovibrio sp. JC047]NDV18764.1 DEAD/DEAH box helicase [Pseudodesulfovibrio sp. JC047]